MRNIPRTISNVTVLYAVFSFNIAIYRLAVLMISTLPTKHFLLSFVHIFVINRLKFGKTCIGTCLATSDNLYQRIIASPISKSDKEKETIKSPTFHLPRNNAEYRYQGIF